MTKKNATKVAARARQAAHGGNYAAHHRIVGGGGPSGPTTKPWMCTHCKKPIAAGDGYILVMDPGSKGYPNPQPTKSDPPTDHGMTFQSFADLKPRRPDVEYDVLHHECDPNPDTNPYWFAVERADTLEAWCGWVHHLGEKTWMGTWDMRRMIAFWFSNRGEDIYKQAG